MISRRLRPHHSRGEPKLMFAPLAWLKLAYFCHAGDTEIAGFAITAKNDPLYVEEFVTVKQQATAATVRLDDQAVADFLDRAVDVGLKPEQVLRIWLHTHPGSSAEPSGTDEDTFARVFGTCDWAVMFILSRTDQIYARLSFHVGPGADMQIPVAIDWRAWPGVVNDPALSMANRFAEWQQEFAANVIPEPLHLFSPPPIETTLAVASPFEPFAGSWDWNDLEQQHWEEWEQYERAFNDDIRA